MSDLKIDYTKCTYCMECVDICAPEALTYNGALNEFNFISEECTYCETCLDVCEVEAITITSD